MKIKIDTKLLHKTMTALLKTVSAKNTLPILDNVLLHVKNGVVTMTTYDTETAITAEIQTLDVQGEASVAIPAKLLASLLSTLPAGEMTFEYESGQPSAKCSWDSGDSVFPAFNALDFPEIPEVKQDNEPARFTQKFLRSALTKTVSVTAKDGIRPALGCVFFQMREDGTTFVGSDSHTLVCVDSKVTGNSAFLLPAKSAATIKSMLEDNGDAAIKADQFNAVFEFSNYRVTARLCNSKYPAFRNVIPVNNPNRLEVKKKDFMAVLKRIMVCANSSSQMIVLKLSYNEVEVNAQDLAFSISARENMSCEYDGEDMNIGFKGTALLQLLENIESEDIEIRFLSSNKATLLQPTGKEADEEPVTAIIMPSVVAG